MSGLALTPRQVVERMLLNDARNIDAAQRMPLTPSECAFVIASCARRLFEARAIDRDLERQAEHNLRRVLGL
jgi:hypothetical protein